MDIVVLAGGLSTERDVSFVTGDMITNALRKKGHRVILLDVFMGYEQKECDLKDAFDHEKEMSVVVGKIEDTAPDIAKIKAQRKDQSNTFFGPNVISLCQKAEIVFIALHGENGENGKVQAAFDLFGIKYTGSEYLGSAIAMNKELTKQFFRQNNIPTPGGILLKKEHKHMKFSDIKVSLPWVIKPCSGGSSIGVSIVRTKQEYQKAIEEAFLYEDEVILEEYIKGREFSVGVMDGKALPIIEIAPIEGFYDYKNKYKAGSAIETCPAELSLEITEQMQYYAVLAAKVLDLKVYPRMDFLMDENENLYCLEANTLPGMTPTSLVPQEAKALGISFEDLCEQVISLSLKKYEE